MTKRPLSIYVHIPFCIRKCLYCDFLSFPVGGEAGEKTKRYLEKLRAEITAWGERCTDRRVCSVFFGGGTPSVLPGGAMEALMKQIRTAFTVEADAEITAECNPGTLTKEKLNEYRGCGINRLSLGLQSMHEAELRALGRIHTRADFLESFRMAREEGFGNINVDLMSGLPGQTAAGWEQSLRQTAELGAEHISAYSLIIEEGTPFYERYREGEEAPKKEGVPAPENAGRALPVLPLPDEDTEREMVHSTARILAEYGYNQYEISNYAKPGYECRHNLVYWRRGDYLGLGLGAASCMYELRWKNTSDPGRYLRAEFAGSENDPLRCRPDPGTDRGAEEAPAGVSETESTGATSALEEADALSEEDRRFEAVMLGLRLNEGIDRDAFRVRYGCDLWEKKASWIRSGIREGLLDVTEDRIRLTERGRDLLDHLLREY